MGNRRSFVAEQLENRCLLSGTDPALVSSASVLPFNAALAGTQNGGPSRVETVTLTNAGGGFLLFGNGSFTITGKSGAANSAPSAFSVVNAGSLPANLAPGQSVGVQVQYTPGIVGLQQAVLQVNSNDPTTPTFNIDLNGIGTSGQFGTNEPSLAQVFRAYDIPTIVGAGPNDANLNTQKYPINPDASSQEVPMQRLVAANPGQPVTFKAIASFSANTPSISRIGYYTPGDPTSGKELFYVGQADAQTIQPTGIGATSFQPGSTPFGLYAEFPGTALSNGQLDVHYSEDALNVLDPSHGRKIRFFPLKNADGTTVANSYVFATEDFNDPTQFNSFINFVGIVSNVAPAPNASAGSVPSSPTGRNPAVSGVVGTQTAPGSSTLVFNTINKLNTISPDITHNTNTVAIYNTGDTPLIINSLTLSDTHNWMLVNPPAAGTSVAGGSVLDVTVKFIATTNPPHTGDQTNDTKSLTEVPSNSAGGVYTGTLTVNTSDAAVPTHTLNLAGYWQIETEHENEPNIAALTNLLFGYSSNVTGAASTQGTEYPNNGNTVLTYASEVDPSASQGLLIAADPSAPVVVTEAASFHQQYQTVSATDGTVTQGVSSGSESGTTVTLVTTFNNAFKVGDSVTIAGPELVGYPGTYTITSIISPTSFTFQSTMTGLASFSPTASQPATGWYLKGGSTKFLFRDQPNNGQALLPLQMKANYSTTQQFFSPTGQFGLNFDGQKSQDSANSGNLQFNTSGHSLRFFPLVDAAGNALPNTYIVGMDYRNYLNPNGDYQDLYEIVSNISFVALPATPVDVQATAGTTGVNLQWAPVNSVSGYNVYRVVNGTQTKLNSSPVTSPSFVDTTAQVGASISYRVTAVNSSGAESPADATAINFSSVAPSEPTINSADGSGGKVTLSYGPVAGATSYSIEREAAGQTSFTTIATGVTSTTYVDTSVTAGATYSYAVVAQNSSGTSQVSAPQSVTVSAAAATAPAAPTITQVDGSSGASVSLSWTAVSNAASYTVLREDPGQTTFTTVASNLTATSYIDASVVPGATYTYAVLAVNSVGSSPLSAPTSVMVAASQATLPAPTNVQVDASSSTQIVITWSASAGAATYNVLREAPGSSTFVEVATGLSATSYTDTSIIAGATYQYEVQAINGSAFSPNSATISGTLPAPGATLDVVVGKGADKFVQFADANGTTSIIRLNGPGTATVHFTGSSLAQSIVRGASIVSGTGVAVASIAVAGSTRASSLLVTSRGGSGSLTLGTLSTSSALNSIVARTATLIGGLSVAGPLNLLALGSVNSASISVGGALQNFTVVAANGASLTTAGPVRNLTAATWSSTGVISAPSINAINIKGNATLNVSTAILHALHVKGTLSGSTIGLTGAGAIDLATLTAGAISGSTVTASGNLGSIVTGSLASSKVYAGVVAPTIFPAVLTDFSAASFINNLTLRKTPGGTSLINSFIAATLIKHASLGTIQTSNGGSPFGVAATNVSVLSFVKPSTGKAVALNRLSSQATVAADLAAKGISPGDFVIRIV